MSKYKVGDKVLLQGEVIKIEKDNVPYPYGIRIANNAGVEFMFCEEEMISKTYEQGLNDAWELARKIENKLDIPTAREIFEAYRIADILDNFTPQEALAKIEAYEESKAIKVGDVVRRISGNEEYLIITEEEDDSVYEYGVIVLKSMTIDRITGDLSKFEKTGRHIDIEHLLKQIRGNE